MTLLENTSLVFYHRNVIKVFLQQNLNCIIVFQLIEWNVYLPAVERPQVVSDDLVFLMLCKYTDLFSIEK